MRARRADALLPHGDISLSYIDLENYYTIFHYIDLSQVDITMILTDKRKYFDQIQRNETYVATLTKKVLRN